MPRGYGSEAAFRKTPRVSARPAPDMDAPARWLREKSPARRPTAGETPAKRSRAVGAAGAWVDASQRGSLLARPPASPVPFAADTSDIGLLDAHTSMETDTSGSAASSLSPYRGSGRRVEHAAGTPRRLFGAAEADEFGENEGMGAHHGAQRPPQRGAELWSWSGSGPHADANASTLADQSAVEEESPSNASSIPLPDQVRDRRRGAVTPGGGLAGSLGCWEVQGCWEAPLTLPLPLADCV